MLNTNKTKKDSFSEKHELWKKFLICFCMLIITCPAFPQNQIVKIKGKDLTIKAAFNQIEKQTGLTIAYDESLLNVNQRIKGDIKSTKLSDALTEILKETKSEFLFQNKHVVIRTKSALPAGNNNQSTPSNSVKKTKTITGKITDAETGEPIIGASVVEKGTMNGMMTDVNGNFKLTVPEDALLTISYVGYTNQELNTTGQTSLNILLSQAAKALDEVVVVGMNIRQIKRSVTGAMATIQTKELVQSPTANLNNALAGKLPGLITVQSSGQPGDDAARMYIRGVSTYGATTTPLIVIDGLPRSQGDFSQIDPNEVESISILKDASSSALYGIQGANGIIVVTTKRGKADQKPSIDFTMQSGIQQVMRLPTRASLYSSALYFNEMDKNDNKTLRFSNEVLDIIKSSKEPYLYPEVNWFDEILKKNAIQNQYNINISGSSKNIHYFVSGSYINQGSLLKHENLFYDNYKKKSGFDRYNFRSNVDIQALPNLDIQVDLAGRLEKRVGPSSGFQDVFNVIESMPVFALPVFNPDGSLGAASNVEIPYYRNPYGLVTQAGYYENRTNAMYGTISAKYNLNKLIDGLAIQGFFSFENNNTNYTTRSQEFDAYWYRGINAEGKPWYQQTRIATTLSQSGRNGIEQSNYIDLRLLYDKKIKEHNFSAQLMGNRTLRIINQELPYAYQGISARATYGFRQKYFAEMNLAYNGSENFPPKSRYGLFPSASIGWIASDENFLKDVNWLRYLKIRGSFGSVGNDKIGGQRWMYISDYRSGGGYEFGVNPIENGGYNESSVGNPYVTWERAQKGNIGFEIAVLKNLLQLSFDVFKEKRSKILTPPGTVPEYLGLGELSPINVGVVDNKGFDGELKINHIVKKTFRFFTNIQFTYTKNKVIQNDQPIPAFPYQDLRGYPIGYVLGYKAIGLFHDEKEIEDSPKQSFDNKTIPGDIKYEDINNDKVIDNFDRIPIQTFNVPQWMFGFSTGFNYKNFDFSVLFNGATGGKELYYSGIVSEYAMNNYWSEKNKENAKLPVPKTSVNNWLPSDFYIVKSDYLKLRNMEIGYHFSKIRKIQNMRIFVNGQNLFVLDKLPEKSRDPETLGGGLTYPIQRVINIGIHITY